MLAGAICSMAPDIDVVGFHFGIRYQDLLGHRGLTHSFAFAAVIACLALFAACPKGSPRIHKGLVWLYLFLAAASHCLLDAMTDGGLGIAFFAPFSNTRYFFPFRPICVCPIGASAFMSAQGLTVLLNEILWVWLPASVFAVMAFTIRRLWPGRTRPDRLY